MGTGNARVEERATSYAISYVNETAGDAPGLVKATLVLRRTDLYPIEQTLLVQQGSELREYRLTETRFELRPINAVAPRVFEPEPELLGLPASPGNRAVEKSKSAISLGPQPAMPQPIAATAELEVEALRLLNQAGADLGEQISVSRTSDGELKIQGIIETDRRKAEILRALTPIIGHPSVRVEIKTVEESLAEQRQSRVSPGSKLVQRFETARDLFPAYSDLRRQFTDDEARAFAARIVNHSHQAMRHAWALKRLVNQFSSEDLRTMNPEAHAQWLTLIRNHARSFEHETIDLRRELQPIFSSSTTDNEESSGFEITNDAELVRAIQRLIQLATANDQVIGSEFSISTNDVETTAIKAPQFWRLMKSSEALAVQIQSAK